MQIIEKERTIIKKDTNGKIALVKTGEKYFEIIPDAGKAFINKNTKKVFIHSNKHEGLPLTINNKEDLDIYEEVKI